MSIRRVRRGLCGLIALVSMVFTSGALGQAVDKKKVDAYLANGDLAKAEKTLSGYFQKRFAMSRDDSIYVLKNLGVLYASNMRKKAEGDKLFIRLLETDPFANINDTYAGESTLLRFRSLRQKFQKDRGGLSLRANTMVLDFMGSALSTSEKEALTERFIDELTRLGFFHVPERPAILDGLRRVRATSEGCLSTACQSELGRKLDADKVVAVEVERIAGVLALKLDCINAETGKIEASIRKSFENGVRQILESGLAQLAVELRDSQAAWLSLTLDPRNTLLTVNGEEYDSVVTRLALQPGKHHICGRSPGYLTTCRDFEVRRGDPVSYLFSLPLKGTASVAAPEEKATGTEASGEEEGKGGERRYMWYTLGAMAALALLLAAVFNSGG